MTNFLPGLLLALGLILIGCGLAAECFRSRAHVPDYFPGSLRDRAMWMLVGGTVLALGGLAGLLSGTGSI